MTRNEGISKYEIVGLRKIITELAKSADPELLSQTSRLPLLKFVAVASEVLAGIDVEPVRARAAQILLSTADYPGRHHVHLVDRTTQAFVTEVRAAGYPDISASVLTRHLADEDSRLFCAPPAGEELDTQPAILVVPPNVQLDELLGMPLLLFRCDFGYIPAPIADGPEAAPDGRLFCVFQATADRSEHSVYARCVRAICARVAQINARHPELQLNASEPLPLSEALRKSELEQLRTELSNHILKIHDLARNTWKVSMDLARISITSWPEKNMQTFDVMLMARTSDFIGFGFRRNMSFTTSLSTLSLDLASLFRGLGLEVEVIPGASHLGFTLKQKGQLFPDVDGRWLPAVLFSIGRQARKLVNSVRWLKTLEARDTHERREMLAWPFPFLYKQVNTAQAVRDHFCPEVANQILTLCGEPGVGFVATQNRVIASHPGYVNLPSKGTDETDPLSIPYELYLSLHFVKCNGRVFHILDTLMERLHLMDIHEDVPVTMLHAPFADCYLHLQTPLIIKNRDAADEERLVGFFVSERAITDPTSGAVRCVAIAPILTGGADMLSAFGGELELLIHSDKEESLLTTINYKLSTRPGFSEKPVNTSDEGFKIVALAAKTLLYLGHKSARVIERRPRSEQMEKRKSSSSSEKRKAGKRAARTYDFIEVGPVKSMAEEEREARQKGFQHVYWRRGYARSQAWGPRWSLHRDQWVFPTLVNADLLDGEPEPEVKDYRLL